MQNAVLHSKIAVADGVWTAIGSSNLDRRSVVFNKEVDVIILILGADTAAQVEGLLQRDFAAAAPITLPAWQKRTVGERFAAQRFSRQVPGARRPASVTGHRAAESRPSPLASPFKRSRDQRRRSRAQPSSHATSHDPCTREEARAYQRNKSGCSTVVPIVLITAATSDYSTTFAEPAI